MTMTERSVPPASEAPPIPEVHLNDDERQDRDWGFSAFIALMLVLALTIGVMVVLGCDPLGCR